MEPTCLSCGHGQPPLPGVPCRCTRYIYRESFEASCCFNVQQETPSRGGQSSHLHSVSVSVEIRCSLLSIEYHASGWGGLGVVMWAVYSRAGAMELLPVTLFNQSCGTEFQSRMVKGKKDCWYSIVMALSCLNLCLFTTLVRRLDGANEWFHCDGCATADDLVQRNQQTWGRIDTNVIE